MIWLVRRIMILLAPMAIVPSILLLVIGNNDRCLRAVVGFSVLYIALMFVGLIRSLFRYAAAIRSGGRIGA